MRLINVEDIHISVMGGRMNGKRAVADEIAKAVEKAIKEEPEVDAIPVEWLLKQGKVAFPSDSVEFIRETEQYNRTITDLIAKWRAEHERNHN